MNAREYRSILERLPIKNPTPQDMALLCPHLMAAEAVQTFNDFGYVACPPLRIRRSFHIVSYLKKPICLNLPYACRTQASYADNKPHGGVFLPHEHQDAAMKFAEDNWGDNLILDNWASVLRLDLQDPTDLVNDRHHVDYPRTKAVLCVALNRGFDEIINDPSKPTSELLDAAILEMTLDSIVGQEFTGGRDECYRQYNCAHCGAGLSLSSCTGCDFRFKDDYSRSGWRTPLSRKMVAFLHENGYPFEVDPGIAWMKERQDWESNCQVYEEMQRNWLANQL